MSNDIRLLDAENKGLLPKKGAVRINMLCKIITEGMVGTQNQCAAVAYALKTNPMVTQMSLREPWKTLSPWLGFENPYCFTAPLTPPWPDLLITSGRKSIAAARYIKRKSQNDCFTLHIQDPKISPKGFDLVAVAHHDSMRGDNVIVTDGAPNLITSSLLNKARDDFADQFGAMPSPRVAVLIGGNSRTHKFTPNIARKMVDDLNALDASLMITASRRTGEENFNTLKDNIRKENAFFWDGTGTNPYHGMLAWCDYIIVTNDSVSMTSDAGTTGKPTYVYPLEGGSARFTRFDTHMADLGVTRPFDGTLSPWSYEPLNDAQKIADAVKKRMG